MEQRGKYTRSCCEKQNLLNFENYLIDFSSIYPLSQYIFFLTYIITKIFFKGKCCLKFHSTDVPTFLEHSIYGNLLCSIHIYNRKKFFHIIAE